MQRERYQGKSDRKRKKQGPVTGVTLKQGDNMAEKPKYYVEVFVQDFHGKRISLGTHETHVENWTLCVEVTPRPDSLANHLVEPNLTLANIVSCIHLEFKGKVQP